MFSTVCRPMTTEEKFAVIQQHKNYVVFELCGGDFQKGDRVIVGTSPSDRRLATIKRTYKRSIVTECGLKFERRNLYLGRLEAQNGERMLDVDHTYKWLNLELPLDSILAYLSAIYEFECYQYGASVYDFQVTGFTENSYPKSFVIRKHPASSLSKERLQSLDEYDRRHRPDWKIIDFETVKDWIQEAR